MLSKSSTDDRRCEFKVEEQESADVLADEDNAVIRSLESLMLEDEVGDAAKMNISKYCPHPLPDVNDKPNKTLSNCNNFSSNWSSASSDLLISPASVFSTASSCNAEHFTSYLLPPALTSVTQQQQQYLPDVHSKSRGRNNLIVGSQSLDRDTIGQSAVSSIGQKSAQVEMFDNRLKGKVYAMSKDQYGCRYLQSLLESGDESIKATIYQEVISNLPDLMIDSFGNYLCQKLIQVANHEQIEEILQQVCPFLVGISMNVHGTRSIQKLITRLADPEAIQTLCRYVEYGLLSLMKDVNGNHVIQKCLHCFDLKYVQFIYQAVCDNVIQVACHRHGCCVFKRCYDYSSGSQLHQLNSAVYDYVYQLSTDPYGNYVVQYAIDCTQDIAYNDQLALKLQGSISQLSLQKFSSNVVESLLRKSSPNVRNLMVDCIIAAVQYLLRDTFGNYVLITALDCADTEKRQQLVHAIQSELTGLFRVPAMVSKVSPKILHYLYR
ncbi:hypothetical protein MP228_001428 [Amoeboaphelidium protococcarum]|nr:hypothetical protein MP228_001428 [Amoeboaphelidium protococcarum]